MLLIILLNTQTMHTKSKTNNSYILPKTLHLPWRDSNPGLLSLRPMHCPLLRHAARAPLVFSHIRSSDFSYDNASSVLAVQFQQHMCVSSYIGMSNAALIYFNCICVQED
jgi:hypothetical protein